MTKFETIGVNYQYAASSKAEANSAFAHSCNCCCNKGMRLDCDRCAIAHTHSLVVAYFADREMKCAERKSCEEAQISEYKSCKGEQHKINEEANAS